MYTRGTISLVHANGRICYEGQLTRADGADEAYAAATLGCATAEQDVEVAEAAVAARADGATVCLADAENALDVAMETLLAVEAESVMFSAPVKPGQLPVSFSRVDPARPQNELAREFPAFLRTTELVVEIHAGEMLYLPAGWFHEVVSSGGQHMAFNYWCHPPTLLDASGPSPLYTDDFWLRDYSGRSSAEIFGTFDEVGSQSEESQCLDDESAEDDEDLLNEEPKAKRVRPS